MKYLALFFTYLVVIEHFYFFILESFLWTKKKTVKIFGLKSIEFAHETKVLAANQGLYNCFLAVGLLLSTFLKDDFYIQMFLCFVVTAGIVGAITTQKIRLFWVQGLPALIALILNLLMSL